MQLIVCSYRVKIFSHGIGVTNSDVFKLRLLLILDVLLIILRQNVSHLLENEKVRLRTETSVS